MFRLSCDTYLVGTFSPTATDYIRAKTNFNLSPIYYARKS